MAGVPDPKEVVDALRGTGEASTRMSAAERALAVELIGPGPTTWAADLIESSLRALLVLEPSDALFPIEEVGLACERVLLAILTELATGRPVTRDPALYSHPLIINDIVTRDIGLLDVAAAMRLVQEHWIHSLVEEAHRVGVAGAVVGVVVKTVTAAWDRFVGAYVASYLVEHERFLNTSSAQGREIVASLAAGEPVSARLVRSTLGVSVQDHHVGLVVTTRGRLKVAPETLTTFTAAAARTVGARSVVRYQTTDGALWSWLTRPLPVNPADLALIATPSEPLVVGIGGSHSGADGFRRTHLEAKDAARLGLGGHRDLVRYDDVALLARITGDLERADWFVTHELGPLATDSPGMAELRTTLSAFFAARMRLASAAAQQHMHRNTLIHRIQRIEKLIGHPVTERTAELQCALMVFTEIGPSLTVPKAKKQLELAPSGHLPQRSDHDGRDLAGGL